MFRLIIVSKYKLLSIQSIVRNIASDSASVIAFDCGQDCFWNCKLILKSTHSTVVRNMKSVWMLHCLAKWLSWSPHS